MQLTIHRRRAIEITVVVGVVAVVLAVILSNTFGLRASSRTAAAQSLARSALMIQRNYYYGSGEYADAETLRKGEPAVDAVEDVAVKGKVYVRTEGQTTTLASSTDDGTCYWIKDSNGVASYAKTPCEAEPTAEDFAASW